MNYIINKLLCIIYILKSKLLHYQEKLCYKMVIKYCKTNPIFKNEEMVVYSEISYYDGRDANIIFGFKNFEDDDVEWMEKAIYITFRDKLLHYDFGHIVYKIEDIDADDNRLFLIYSK